MINSALNPICSLRNPCPTSAGAAHTMHQHGPCSPPPATAQQTHAALAEEAQPRMGSAAHRTLQLQRYQEFIKQHYQQPESQILCPGSTTMTGAVASNQATPPSGTVCTMQQMHVAHQCVYHLLHKAFIITHVCKKLRCRYHREHWRKVLTCCICALQQVQLITAPTAQHLLCTQQHLSCNQHRSKGHLQPHSSSRAAHPTGHCSCSATTSSSGSTTRKRCSSTQPVQVTLQSPPMQQRPACLVLLVWQWLN